MLYYVEQEYFRDPAPALKYSEDDFLRRHRAQNADRYIFLSRALAVTMNLFGPGKTILDGWFMESPRYMQRIHAHLARFTVDGGYDSSWVVPASLGKRNYVIGAATMVLHQLFKGKVSVT
ncbi:ROK family protein [Paenibacillus thiaminolyticus]|uniref:ROK family protein n=1 Tax=Paenibacillus thiaminolyticus TaxID=49283 RepID=A0A3A3GL08_PANTH|nr:ROK family protein [Paenibacillus thiaminolyticus]RJG23077.1 ROK family protein [Paenibacillus thiaminolyticus]